ncbi:MAG TPA: hypothetical protein VMA37_06895 [Acetobacteraceae bacterium]|nr:hypothetical protein [Acetobacteraceae bacterium]
MIPCFMPSSTMMAFAGLFRLAPEALRGSGAVCHESISKENRSVRAIASGGARTLIRGPFIKLFGSRNHRTILKWDRSIADEMFSSGSPNRFCRDTDML